MAPEQLRGDDAGPQADLYALGVVLFEMVTGERPYQADNTMSLLVKRVSDPPRTPRSIVPTLAARWDATIITCLEREPADRYRSALDVLVALTGTPGAGVRGWTQPLPRLPNAEVRRTGIPRWLVPVGVSMIALAAFLAWMARAGSVRPPTPATLAPIQLTTAPGLELDPAFSPDGEAVVYSGNTTGAFELYVRDLSPGGSDTQLTFGGTQAFEASWSPDGRFIVFHGAAAGGIWQVPAGGGEPSRLTGFGARPALSPDGNLLAYQSESLPALSDTAAPALARSQLWLLELDGGDPRPLTEVGRPAGGHAAPCFSPDGRRVVFTSSQRGRSEIWSIDTSGSEPIPLVREPSGAFDPVFGHAGDAVYFSASDRQVNGLWRVPVSKRTGEALAPAEQVANIGLASIRQLAVSPSGTVAAYTALVTTSNLYRLNVNAAGVPTGAPKALTTGSGRNNRAVFSPDGRWLAYDHWRLGVRIDLWKLEVATGSAQQLTTDSYANTQPSWFPDGEGLLFSSQREAHRALWRVDLASAEISRVMLLDDDVDWARLSPNGTRIAYHTRNGGTVINVWVRPLDGGAPQRLTSAGELAGFPVWSPDGAFLAYQLKQAEDSHLMVIPSAGGEPRQLTSGPGQSWPYDFSPDGDKVLFAGERTEGWNIWWVSRTTGEVRRLTDLGRLGRYVRYPVWSPTGERIVFELAETVGDVWMVDRLP